MLATATVHTSGINWESVGTIAAVFLSAFLAVGAYVRRSIKGSVDHLADVLEARLTPNEEFDKLRDRVTVVETVLRERRGR